MDGEWGKADGRGPQGEPRGRRYAMWMEEEGKNAENWVLFEETKRSATLHLYTSVIK